MTTKAQGKGDKATHSKKDDQVSDDTKTIVTETPTAPKGEAPAPQVPTITVPAVPAPPPRPAAMIRHNSDFGYVLNIKKEGWEGVAAMEARAQHCAEWMNAAMAKDPKANDTPLYKKCYAHYKNSLAYAKSLRRQMDEAAKAATAAKQA